MDAVGRPFAKNILWAFAGRGGVIIAGFAATALLTRLLSPHDVGTYYLILGIALAASPLANLSLDEPVIRAVAVGRGNGAQNRVVAFVRASQRLACISSLTTLALIVLCWEAYRHFVNGALTHSVMLAFLAGAWTAIFAMERQCVATLQGMENIATAAIYDMALGRVLSCVALFILWVLAEHPTVIEILAIYVSCEALSLAGAAWSAHRTLGRLGAEDCSIPWREILAANWPFTVQVVTTAASGQAGIFILGACRSVEEVAIYSIAARLPALLATPGTIVNVPLAPMIARLYAGEEQAELQKVLQVAATIPTAMAIIATVWWAFDGRQLLTLIFGPQYGVGAKAMLILALSQCANLYFGPSMLTLSMAGEQSLAMKIGLIGMLGQAVVILIFVQYWGAVGVAAGVLVSNFLIKAGGWYVVRSRFGIWSHADMRKLLSFGRRVCAGMRNARPDESK